MPANPRTTAANSQKIIFLMFIDSLPYSQPYDVLETDDVLTSDIDKTLA
jgi:hypothetical protein